MKAVRSVFAGRQTKVLIGTALVAALALVPVLKSVDARGGDTGPDPDLLYFSSPSVVKKMAMGYENLLADIYWLRTIQYFGRRNEADKREIRFKNLPTFLDITTTLDPGLMDAYRMGYIFLGEDEPVGAGKPEEAIRLLDKGIEANPEEWRLRLDKGFVYYIYLDDFQSAGHVWLEAGRRPESPEWMSHLAVETLSKGGSIDIARALWKQQYDESTREDVRENARNKLMSLQVAEDLWTLEYLLEQYRSDAGNYPESLAELASHISGKIPAADPLGTPYEYDPDSGEVRLSELSKVPYVEVSESYREDVLRNISQN